MLESFFIYGNIPLNIEKGTYIPLLVLLSYIIASFSSYAGLTLAVRISNAQTIQRKRVLHWAGAFALGSGIWSMHFIGMLAYKMHMTVHYEPWLTILSMVIAILVAWSVLKVTQVPKLSLKRLAISALLLGFGICAMHYIGMEAMEMDASIRYIPSLFLLSVIIAIAASGAALWIMSFLGKYSGDKQVIWRIIAALIMGFAICGMHYTGIEASVIIPFAHCHIDPNQSFWGLAMSVIAVTGTISIMVLILDVSQRLLALTSCSIILAFPLVTIVYQAISELDSDIYFAQKVQYGMKYHNKLIDLLQRMQELRGTIFVVRNGGFAMAGQIEARKQTVRHEIAAIDSMILHFDEMEDLNQSWQNIKNRCLALMETGERSTPEHEFEEYSEIIDAMDDLMDGISDTAGLTLNATIDTDYLADVMTSGIPDFMETMGKTRGLLSGLLASGKTPPEWTEEETRRLQTLYERLKFLDEDIQYVLHRAKLASDRSGSFLDYHDTIIEPKLDAFRHHMERMIFSHKEDLSFSDVFNMATDIITHYDALYDKESDSFLTLVEQREQDYIAKRNLVLYSSIIAFLGLIALFMVLFNTLVRTERAEREAIAASHTKSEFLANMSHELRTPLNSILGMLRLLMESNLAEAQEELAGTAFRSSVNLLEIVNDILDLSKIEAGEMKLESIGFDIQYVFHSVVHALEHVAREKRVPIIRHYDKDSFPFLLGDPTRLSRVLTNLIGNAIKYTDKGHIDVRAFCRKLDNTHVELRCEITDTGIGIAKEKHEAIFEKFSQADGSTTRKYGGTGLGLTITKQLVELMGGKIDVESEIGQGSTFWFTIPYEITDKLNEDKHIRKLKLFSGTIPPEEARILVAEDHPLNQLFIKKVLERFGIKNFGIVENGAEAIEAYQKEAWNVILMDCHMPEKNGYETTKEIRDLEKMTGTHIPIIAMTANAMVGDREKCLRYGMDEYISKPINVDELKEALSQWLLFKENPVEDTKKNNSEDKAVLDLSQLRSFTEGDVEIEKELMRVFIQQSDKNIVALKETSGGTNDKTWVEAAHMFKGGAGGIGAGTLHKLCDQAQHFSGTIKERGALYDAITAEYERVKSTLRGLGLLS